MQIEFEISQDLADIRSALHKRVMLGDIFGTTPTVEDELLRDIKGQSTGIGKTDSFVSNEEREEINGRIERIRNWVIAHGEQKEEDGKEIYVSTAQGIDVIAYRAREGQPGDIDYYLFLYSDKQNGLAELVFDVDFQKKYKLEIKFESKPSKHQLPDLTDFTMYLTKLDSKQTVKHPSYRYSSGTHNLEDMDSREFRIISFYLDQFMRAK